MAVSYNLVIFGYQLLYMGTIKKIREKKEFPTLPLKEMPLDVRKYVLQVQGNMKAKKGISQYSQQLTIYQIIREHKVFSEQQKC